MFRNYVTQITHSMRRLHTSEIKQLGDTYNLLVTKNSNATVWSCVKAILKQQHWQCTQRLADDESTYEDYTKGSSTLTLLSSQFMGIDISTKGEAGKENLESIKKSLDIQLASISSDSKSR